MRGWVANVLQVVGAVALVAATVIVSAGLGVSAVVCVGLGLLMFGVFAVIAGVVMELT
jgi:hypothetical protein